MRVTASDLRNDIYRILDQVIETGVAVEIERRGRILRIAPPSDVSKTGRLRQRNYLIGEPEDIVHLDWSEHWRP